MASNNKWKENLALEKKNHWAIVKSKNHTELKFIKLCKLNLEKWYFTLDGKLSRACLNIPQT